MQGCDKIIHTETITCVRSFKSLLTVPCWSLYTPPRLHEVLYKLETKLEHQDPNIFPLNEVVRLHGLIDAIKSCHVFGDLVQR